MSLLIAFSLGLAAGFVLAACFVIFICAMLRSDGISKESKPHTAGSGPVPSPTPGDDNGVGPA